MNRLGMAVDLSKASVKTMRDVLTITESPVIFSHSSAFGLCNSSRNVHDEILKLVTKNGGLVMVNFYNKFLSCNENATVHDAVGTYNEMKCAVELIFNYVIMSFMNSRTHGLLTTSSFLSPFRCSFINNTETHLRLGRHMKIN
jgi:microsomal dipeptidase-like Zn-dependent dipeptidase